MNTSKDSVHIDNDTYEQELKKFNQLFFYMTQGVIYRNPEGIIVSANPAAEKILSVRSGGLLGKNFSDLKWFAVREDGTKLPAEEHPSMLAFTERKDIANYILSIKNKNNNERRWLRVDAVPLFIPDDKFPYLVFTIFNDITERIKAEAEYKTIIKSAIDGFWILDQYGKILDVNESYCQMSGYSRTELFSMTILEIFPVASDENIIERLNKCRTNGAIHFESFLKRKDGTTIDVEISVSYSEENDNHFYAFFHDISERNKNELQFKKLYERSPLGYQSLDSNGQFLEVNESWLEMFGYKKNDVIGHSFREFLTPELQLIIEDHFQQFMKNGQVHTEFRMIRKDSKIIDVAVDGKIEYNENGAVKKTHCMINNITARKIAEENIRKLSQAVEQSPTIVVITDTNGIIEYANSKFAEITGYSIQEVIGKTPRILKSGEKPNHEYKELWDTIKSGQEWQGEFHNKKKDNTLYWESAHISPLKNQFGAITHFIGIKENITAKKELDIKLKQALDKAEESDRLKSSLLANMSHEFRTPMTGILGMSTALMETIDDAQQRKMVRSIIQCGKRLMQTLDAVLELANLESHSNNKEYELINISKTIPILISKFTAKAKQKGLRFHYEINNDSIFVRSKHKMISEIVFQLLDNAIKFTDEGSVVFCVDTVTIKKEPFVKLVVKDSGIGIPKEYQEIIFKEFRQVSEGISRSYEGAGLGLSIVKKMTNLMSGEIIVESEVGKGSTFTVILPTEASETTSFPEQIIKPVLKKSKTPELKPKSILEVLLVEDTIINAQVAAIYLKDICKIKHVRNGLTAVKMAQDNNYPLILMDINLGPGIDGIRTTKEIRKIPGYEEVPFIALTGYSMESDKNKFLSEGLNYFLPKPFSREEIRDLVSEILS
jgi:PAS domain S-box-containing protein